MSTPHTGAGGTGPLLLAAVVKACRSENRRSLSAAAAADGQGVAAPPPRRGGCPPLEAFLTPDQWTRFDRVHNHRIGMGSADMRY